MKKIKLFKIILLKYTEQRFMTDANFELAQLGAAGMVLCVSCFFWSHGFVIYYVNHGV